MNSRLDICFAVNTLSQYMVDPRCVHLIIEKHVLRYLRDIVDYGLRYIVDCEFKLLGYTYSNWVDSVTDRKSTSRCCFRLGSYMISWLSRKHASVALNMDKVEYIEANSTCSEAMCLQKLLARLFDLELDMTCIFYDNQNCIKLSENPVFHDKSKNIEIKYHYI